MIEFQVNCATNSVHWVNVTVCNTVADMRRRLHKLEPGSCKDTLAACVQSYDCATTHRIADIFFAKPHLEVAIVVHEATHAAFHKANLMGLKYESDDFQEWLCEVSGTLTEGIIRYLDSKKVYVRYSR